LTPLRRATEHDGFVLSIRVARFIVPQLASCGFYDRSEGGEKGIYRIAMQLADKGDANWIAATRDAIRCDVLDLRKHPCRCHLSAATLASRKPECLSLNWCRCRQGQDIGHSSAEHAKVGG